jgi:hypothetical protein
MIPIVGINYSSVIILMLPTMPDLRYTLRYGFRRKSWMRRQYDVSAAPAGQAGDAAQ